jgi:DNA-binding HxlR family transcriptional regulator
MALKEINTKLAKVALDNCEGFPFEEFANDFMAAIEGTDFIPVGGTSDGGADGVHERGLYGSNKKNVFYQMSIEQNHRSKVKKTIDRLIEFGREPKRLIYVTSQIIGTYDREEEFLTDKHNVFVRIRDGKWILSNLNHSEATKKAYYTHLERYTDFLKDLNKGNNVKLSANISHPSVYVFLQQQVENREKDKNLVKTVADSLILWALNDTDPDENRFMTQTDIMESIRNNIPWAKNIVGGMLNHRLKELVSKGGVGGKKVNYHKKGDKYCLPYETRVIIANEKGEDESVQIDVIDEICSIEALADFEPEDKKLVAKVSIRTAQLFFEKEGLNCSSFLNDKESEKDSFIENTVYDRTSDALNELVESEGERERFCPIICEIVRKMFYQSTISQRALLTKFSRTYVLLFTLQAEPRVVEYFQKATANFRLLVGTDLIIRAISERFLSEENQMTRNLFKIANAAGITLYLTEPALDGVIKHLIVTDNEYKNHIQPRESYLTIDLIRESSQILIRTYYHAKMEGYTKSWPGFVSEFITYSQLHNAPGREEFKTYITQQFGMEYISSEELQEKTSPKDVETLSNEIIDLKKSNKPLADAVSLTINSVYGQRRANKEYSTFPEYGYQTWWLTQESRVQKHTSEIVKKNGAKFIMRPEFLLNFFSLSPSVRDIRESYKTIFPSVMGIQMGNRLPDELFHKVLEQVDIWKEQEDGRVAAKTRALCDRLKAEHYDEDANGNMIDHILNELEID